MEGLKRLGSLVLAGGLLVGCAQASTNLVKAGRIKVSLGSPESKRVTRIYAMEREGVIEVGGDWDRRKNWPSVERGHLDLAFYDAEGKGLAASSVRFGPRAGWKSPLSHFSAKFSGPVPDGSSLRVAYHPDQNEDPGQFSCGDNQAIVRAGEGH